MADRVPGDAVESRLSLDEAALVRLREVTRRYLNGTVALAEVDLVIGRGSPWP